MRYKVDETNTAETVFQKGNAALPYKTKHAQIIANLSKGEDAKLRVYSSKKARIAGLPKS
jgi:hypothetical protein